MTTVHDLETSPTRRPDEALYGSDRTVVRRARAAAGDIDVIVKQPLGPGAQARLRHERAILERLAAVAGVAQLAPEQELPGALVLVDDNGRALADVIARHPLP